MKKLGFGCMRLPLIDPKDETSVNFEMMCEMVDTFLEHGFTYFDTAYMYHQYTSECMVKKALVERHPRESFLLADKLPTMKLEKVEDMERIFNEQLEKTGVDYFDYYLLHNLNKNTYEIATKLNAFDFVSQKKKEGKVKRMGFSYHDDAALLDEILSNHPEVEFVQLQLNYMDWDSEEIQSGKCYEVCMKHNKDVIVMEPIKGGSLVNIPDSAKDLLKAKRPELSIASWAIRYAASKDRVIMVLSGMSNFEQMKDNISYMENFEPLNQDEQGLMTQVVKVIKETTKVPCTACRYCVEGCPMQIAIPEYFDIYNEYHRFKNLSRAKRHYANLTKEHGKASECIACGQCEKACPQHLSIIDFLKEVSNVLED